VCRFFFVVPLLIIAVDAVRDTHVMMNNSFSSDLLAMVAGVGCVISSMITVLIFFPRSHEQEAGYRYRERPMTELWSDDDEKARLAGGMDGDYKTSLAGRGDMVSRMDMEDRDPYAYRPQSDSTYLGSGSNINSESRFDGDPSVISPQPQRSHDSLVLGPAPLLEPRGHPHIPTDTRASRSPPNPRPEKRRSRRPTWEVVSMDQAEYFVGDSSGVVATSDPSSGVANLSRSHSARSNLHPILQHYSSPIDVFDAQRRSSIGIAI